MLFRSSSSRRLPVIEPVVETKPTVVADVFEPKERFLAVNEKRDPPRQTLRELFQDSTMLGKAVAAMDEIKKLQSRYPDLLKSGMGIKNARDANARLLTPTQVIY